MKDAHLFEISRRLDAIAEFLPLGLEYVNLQVLIEVVDQEAHVLSQLQSHSEHRLLTEVFHTADLLGPDVLQLKLYALDRQEEAVQGVVFLMDIGTEHQVNRPRTLVNQGQTTPRIFLISFDTALEHPVLYHQNVS